MLSDCDYVITRRAGPRAVQKLDEAGIESFEDHDQIDMAISRLINSIEQKTRL